MWHVKVTLLFIYFLFPLQGAPSFLHVCMWIGTSRGLQCWGNWEEYIDTRHCRSSMTTPSSLLTEGLFPNIKNESAHFNWYHIYIYMVHNCICMWSVIIPPRSMETSLLSSWLYTLQLLVGVCARVGLCVLQRIHHFGRRCINHSIICTIWSHNKLYAEQCVHSAWFDWCMHGRDHKLLNNSISSYRLCSIFLLILQLTK